MKKIFLIIFGILFSVGADAGNNSNVSGYAWSANIGWVKFQGPIVSQDGLVASWSMDEGQGSTQILDASGNNNTGTLTNMDFGSDWVQGKYGTALDFDGVNDYVSIPATAALTTPKQGTITLWAKGLKETGETRGLITFSDKDTIGQNEATLTLNAALEIVSWRTDINGVPTYELYTPTGSASSAETDWIFIAATSDGTTTSIYINGISQVLTEQKGAGNIGDWIGDVNNIDSIAIGSLRRPSPTYHQGIIDEVRIYNRALTGAEILEQYNGYGVNVNKTTGEFSGHAWSSNLGWLSFNRAETGAPPAEPYKTGSPAYTAKVDEATGNILGWARFLSNDGGWDGWVRFTGPVISQNGLVASWSMDEGTGSTQILDASGNNNTGTLKNMNANQDWVRGKYGTALDFDGGNDYVDAGTKPSLLDLTDFSLGLWVRFADLASNRGLWSWDVGNVEIGYYARTNGQVQWYGHTSAGFVYVSTGAGAVQANTWHYIVLNWDADATAKIYVDSVEKGSANSPGTVDPINWDGFQLSRSGVAAGAGTLWHKGEMDEVRFYNRALTGAEILEQYNGYKTNVNLTSGVFSGFAWSDMVMGWLKFSGVGYGVIGPPGILNDPPSAPTLNEEVAEHCAISSESLYIFSWNYSDPDGDPQAAYEVQMSEDSGFPPPTAKFNHIVDSASNSYTLNIYDDDDLVDGTLDPGDLPLSMEDYQLDWNGTYFWRIRVKDSVGNWSAWSNSNQLKTPKQSYPFPGFSWEPLEPVQKEVVIFTPDDLDEVEYNYFWEIIWGSGTPADGTGPTNAEPHYVFEDYDNRVKLTITRISTGDQCVREEDITAQLPLPEYKEVSPVGLLKDAWNYVLAFLGTF